MHSFRYIIHLIGAFIIRFRIVLLGAAAIGILAFVGLSFILPKIETGKVERIGITGRFTTQNLPNDILALVSDGLTTLDKTGRPQPALAESWEETENGKVWVFKLKKNLVWQDGKPVTSKNITYKFSDAEVETPDDYTIIFKLNAAFSPFPIIVSQPVFKKGLTGTGKWKVSSITMVGSYVSQLTLTDQKNNKKIYKFFPSEDETKTAFKLGKVDILNNLNNPAPFDSWKTIEVFGAPDMQQVVAVFFNTEDSLLSDKSTRQALSYAIDKDGLSQFRAIGPISPLSWTYNPQVKPYNYEQDKAREMVKNLPKEAKGNASIKLYVIPSLLTVGEKIIKNWEAIGFTTSLEVISSLPNQYQAFLAVMDIPLDPDQYTLWHSTQTNSNITNYKNPRIDKLLEDGRVELNADVRRKYYLDFQRFLMEDAPAAFLYHPVYYTVSRK